MKKQIIYIFKTLLLALAVFILSHLVGDLLYGKDEKTLIIAMAAFLAVELVIRTHGTHGDGSFVRFAKTGYNTVEPSPCVSLDWR